MSKLLLQNQFIWNLCHSLLKKKNSSPNFSFTNALQICVILFNHWRVFFVFCFTFFLPYLRYYHLNYIITHFGVHKHWLISLLNYSLSIITLSILFLFLWSHLVIDHIWVFFISVLYAFSISLHRIMKFYRPGDYHTKWSKLERERQTPYDVTDMWSLKYNTNELIYETKQTHIHRDACALGTSVVSDSLWPHEL